LGFQTGKPHRKVTRADPIKLLSIEDRLDIGEQLYTNRPSINRAFDCHGGVTGMLGNFLTGTISDREQHAPIVRTPVIEARWHGDGVLRRSDRF
jgi:hypothetical protein